MILLKDLFVFSFKMQDLYFTKFAPLIEKKFNLHSNKIVLFQGEKEMQKISLDFENHTQYHWNEFKITILQIAQINMQNTLKIRPNDIR
jgi:hypothetical protein